MCCFDFVAVFVNFDNMYDWRFAVVVLYCMQFFIVENTIGAQNSPQCTLKCTERGGSSTCWTNIMDHFTDDLQRALCDYVTAVGHVSQWQHKHKSNIVTKQDIVAESLQRKPSDGGPLSRDDLITIFNAVLNMTSVDQFRRHEPSVELPSLSCPTPCDYYPKMWASLFFITFTAFSLSCLAFVIHLCRNERLNRTVKRDGHLYQPA